MSEEEEEEETKKKKKKNSSCRLQDAFHDTMVHGTSKAQVKSEHLEEQQYKKQKEPSGPRCPGQTPALWK